MAAWTTTRLQLATPPVGLLSLPTELRLQICDHVFNLDLEHEIIKQWRDTHSAEKGFRSVPDLNRQTRFAVPWVALMLTCKTMASDIRALMQQTTFLQDDANRTYVMDLEATRGGMTLGSTTWRRIPCAPDQVHYLEAHYNASRGLQVWGIGGPHGITSGLYQTLNHLVYCGPRLDSEHSLPKPMHLKELRITVENRDTNDDAHYKLSQRDVDPEATLYALGSIVGQIVRTGVLRGSIDRINMVCNDKSLQWSPEEVDGTGVPEYWTRYGFNWGMGLYKECC